MAQQIGLRSGLTLIHKLLSINKTKASSLSSEREEESERIFHIGVVRKGQWLCY